MKIVKNTTGALIELESTGAGIPAGGQITIDASNYNLWATEDTINEITPYINSGDIVINNGTLDLPIDEGIRWLEYPDRIQILQNNTKVIDVLTSVNLVNGITVTNDTNGAVTLAADGEGAVKGRTFNQIFFNNGNTANKWLFHLPTSEATDQLPYHAIINQEIYGISFSNKNSNINCDVEFYVNGTNNPNRVYTMEVRNSRFWHITTLTNLITLNQDDNLSVYIKKVGNPTPSSVEVDIYCRITTNSVGEGGD